MTHGVVSSNPTRVTIDIPLARKATENHLIKSTSLFRALSLVSATPQIEYATQFYAEYEFRLLPSEATRAHGFQTYYIVCALRYITQKGLGTKEAHTYERVDLL